ncbi:GPW/gp25 family protein [Caldilinea sp.]|jgi:phage baseplate assembly protein W|uniref:GPW/gp25 family protein n=1 Tax=Caldilinea sp. TaxID=2293560 RepID=UPI0026366F7D|nr:GPW/gp25 family protein [uncultured Caldilinea sp.]
MNIAYPYAVDGGGRTARAEDEEHIRQLIEQLLFTAPGERVNRPTFGTGLRQLLFAPNSPELATALEFMVQAALQEVLGELIRVEALDVAAEEATLRVAVHYVVQRTQQRQVVEIES